MAARETGFGAVEQYMHAGKLLALELLVRVLENPHHHWSALRPEVRESYTAKTRHSICVLVVTQVRLFLSYPDLMSCLHTLMMDQAPLAFHRLPQTRIASVI